MTSSECQTRRIDCTMMDMTSQIDLHNCTISMVVSPGVCSPASFENSDFSSSVNWIKVRIFSTHVHELKEWLTFFSVDGGIPRKKLLVHSIMRILHDVMCIGLFWGYTSRLSTVPTFPTFLFWSYFFLLFLKILLLFLLFHKKVKKKSLSVLIKWSKIEIYINHSYL